MNNLSKLIRVVIKIGIHPIFSVMTHRLKIRLGLFEKKLPSFIINTNEALWHDTNEVNKSIPTTISKALTANILRRSNEIVNGKFYRFAHELAHEGKYPDWHKGSYKESASLHFSKASINAVHGDDVKISWDLSRMQWVLELALATCVSSEDKAKVYFDRLNMLCQHWLLKNSYYLGINWSCAHEVSLRSFKLMLASLLLESYAKKKTGTLLLAWLEASWKYVYVTRAYGLAQKNNHSFSEAAFLVFGAFFLIHYGIDICSRKTLRSLTKKFYSILERSILADGGCSMYSMGYHRTFCDILIYCKILDDYMDSNILKTKQVIAIAKKMYNFLSVCIEPISGKIPRIGSDDGSAHCLQFVPYDMFEPTLLTMGSVFSFPMPSRVKRAMEYTWIFDYNPVFIADMEESMSRQKTFQFDNFGLLIIQEVHYKLYVKYPRNKFRPSQLDFLHVDLWSEGVNILHDSGTYSYNPERELLGGNPDQLSSHNTLYPLTFKSIFNKLTPFLYNVWPTTTLTRLSDNKWNFSYTIGKNKSVTRNILAQRNRIRLTDSCINLGRWAVGFNSLSIKKLSPHEFRLTSDATRLIITPSAEYSLIKTEYAENYQTIARSQRLVINNATDSVLTCSIEFKKAEN